MDSIYLDGLEYKSTGVILMDIIAEEFIQHEWFDPVDRNKQKKLAVALDQIIEKNGSGSIKIAVLGNGYAKNIRQEHLSQRYSTNLNEIIEIKV